MQIYQSHNYICEKENLERHCKTLGIDVNTIQILLSEDDLFDIEVTAYPYNVKKTIKETYAPNNLSYPLAIHLFSPPSDELIFWLGEPKNNSFPIFFLIDNEHREIVLNSFALKARTIELK